MKERLRRALMEEKEQSPISVEILRREEGMRWKFNYWSGWTPSSEKLLYVYNRLIIRHSVWHILKEVNIQYRIYIYVSYKLCVIHLHHLPLFECSLRYFHLPKHFHFSQYFIHTFIIVTALYHFEYTRLNQPN